MSVSFWSDTLSGVIILTHGCYSPPQPISLFVDKPNIRQRLSAGSSDSMPHSPMGSAPPLPSADSTLPQHRRSSKLR